MVSVLSRLGFPEGAAVRYTVFAREFLWIALGKLLTLLGGAVGVRLLTELLEPLEYGHLALGLTATALIGQAVFGPMSNGSARFYAPARQAGKLGTHLAVVRHMAAAATGGLAFLGCLLTAGLLLAGHTQWIGLCVAALCLSLLSGINSILSALQNAARNRAVVALHHAVASWGRYLTAAVLVVALGSTAQVAIWGYAVAMLLVVVSQTLFVRRIVTSSASRIKPGAEGIREWRRQILDYAWPFATWGVVGWLALSSDRYALQVFASTYDVGVYAVLFQLGYAPVSQLGALTTQLLAPIYFERAGDASDPARVLRVFGLGWNATLLAILGTMMAFLFALLTHRSVFSLLVAEEYRHASGLLPGMVLAAGLVASAHICGVALHSRRTIEFLTVHKIASKVIGVVTISVGALWGGISGVVIGQVVYASVCLAWILLLFHRQQTQAHAHLSATGVPE